MSVQLRWHGVLFAAGILSVTIGLSADDWPEYRGAGRRGVWNETGILEQFPADGLKVVWRAPVKNGYAGPAVAGGRVFFIDFVRSVGRRGVERIMGFDEKTGQAALEAGMGSRLRRGRIRRMARTPRQPWTATRVYVRRRTGSADRR